MFHRRWHALEPLDGAKADVQVEQLAQGDVEGADAAADRGCQRAFDANQVLPKRFYGVVRQPVIIPLLGCLPSKDLEPGNLPLAAVSLLDRGVEYALARRPNVRPCPISADEWNHRINRYHQFPIADGYLSARR